MTLADGLPYDEFVYEDSIAKWVLNNLREGKLNDTLWSFPQIAYSYTTFGNEYITHLLSLAWKYEHQEYKIEPLFCKMVLDWNSKFLIVYSVTKLSDRLCFYIEVSFAQPKFDSDDHWEYSLSSPLFPEIEGMRPDLFENPSGVFGPWSKWDLRTFYNLMKLTLEPHELELFAALEPPEA